MREVGGRQAGGRDYDEQMRPKNSGIGHLRAQSTVESRKFRSKLDKIKGLSMCAMFLLWRQVAHIEEMMLECRWMRL